MKFYKNANQGDVQQFISWYKRLTALYYETLYSRINGDLNGRHVLVSLFVICCIDC